jgi:hypothetical protein
MADVTNSRQYGKKESISAASEYHPVNMSKSTIAGTSLNQTHDYEDQTAPNPFTKHSKLTNSISVTNSLHL